MPEPIGSEIARRHADRFARVAQADRLLVDRTPCEICGHPTGDCNARDHVVAERRRDAENLAGVTTEVDPQVAAMLAGWVVVTEEVLDDRPPPGGGPALTVVKYAPGRLLSAEVAVAEGVPSRPATTDDIESRRSI